MFEGAFFHIGFIFWSMEGREQMIWEGAILYKVSEWIMRKVLLLKLFMMDIYSLQLHMHKLELQ